MAVAGAVVGGERQPGDAARDDGTVDDYDARYARDKYLHKARDLTEETRVAAG